jgi:hypothetical protein
VSQVEEEGASGCFDQMSGEGVRPARGRPVSLDLSFPIGGHRISWSIIWPRNIAFRARLR